MAEPFRYALLGCDEPTPGSWRTAAESLHAKLAAVADRDLERARRVADQLGVPAFSSFEEMVDGASFDRVIVSASWPGLRKVLLQATMLEIDVYCETPVRRGEWSW